MSPHEPSSWPCQECRARLYREEDHCWCNAAGCQVEQICAECLFDCEDCGDGFCRAHVVEIPLGERTAVYRCVACQVRSIALAETRAALPYLDLIAA